MAMRLDTVICGGRVVTPKGTVEADVGVRGEKIAAVEPGLLGKATARRVIDAAGHLVLPGVIDAHVHLDLPVAGTVTSDDYRSGTRAAARGGVTTVVDFATPDPLPGGSHQSLAQALDAWHARATGKAVVDYAFHLAITRWDQHCRELKTMIRRGVPTFKQYMIYRGIDSTERQILQALQTLRGQGGRLMIHAELPSILDELIESHHTRAQMKKFGARLHPMTRPAIVEAEAIRRLIELARWSGGPLYVVHISTGQGAQLVREARAQGVDVVGETCPQYLVLDDSVFARPEGHLFASCPQVKTRADSRTLWRELAAGTLDVLATDTCTFTRAQKNAWGGDWTRVPSGLPGLETLLPLAYTHGVLKKRLTLERMVEVLCEGPARRLGLAGRKGAIRKGADADLVIIHPTRRIAVDPACMETNADWSPYEGWKLAGFARTTLLRGRVIVEDYKVTAGEGGGRWLARKLD